MRVSNLRAKKVKKNQNLKVVERKQTNSADVTVNNVRMFSDEKNNNNDNDNKIYKSFKSFKRVIVLRESMLKSVNGWQMSRTAADCKFCFKSFSWSENRRYERLHKTCPTLRSRSLHPAHWN